MQPTQSELNILGTRIRQSRGGAGEPVLFLHGAGGATPWNEFFETLAGQFDLIVPDHPGFGKSDDPAWLRNVPDVANFYLDYLEDQKLQGVHLIGHSLGGWIAAELAVRNSTRLKSLTLVAPAGIRVKGVPAGDAFIWSPEELVRNLYCDQAWAERQLNQPPTGDEIDIVIKNRYTFAKLAWQPRNFDPNLEKWLHRIHLPTHIIWGDADKLLPVEYGRLWDERIADSKLSILEKCGHIPQVERAREIAEIVCKFIRGIGR
jgi:pimeloyl-ACP methyl ester carboxylesterase